MQQPTKPLVFVAIASGTSSSATRQIRAHRCRRAKDKPSATFGQDIPESVDWEVYVGSLSIGFAFSTL